MGSDREGINPFLEGVSPENELLKPLSNDESGSRMSHLGTFREDKKGLSL